MKRNIKIAALLLSAFFCVNNAQAQDFQNSITYGNLADVSVKTPELVAPVVQDPKLKSNLPTPKVDLNAVVLDPNVILQEELDGTEEYTADSEAQVYETLFDNAKYNLKEALHGEVKAVGTKGLFADKTKMTFKKGPIDNIIPWIDYNGYFSNVWNGENYENTLYSINFADVGVNINMKNPDNYMRIMFSPVKTFAGKNYFQTFFADNYFTHKMGKKKNNTILVGHTWLPMGIEGKESPLMWQFFNRSQLTLKYAGVRTLGTKIMGNYKYASYHLGMYSAGRGFTDWFPGPEFAGWVELKPLANLDEKKYGKLTIGTGLNAGNSNSHYTVGMGAINYEYKRLRAITEFGIADGSNGAQGYTSNQSKGINGTLAYRITPKLQALVRYDQFDPNTDKMNDMRREYTAGINYFIKDHSLKLMLNYVYYNIESGVYGSRILVGTQFIL